jgi:hypothetical protein
VADTEGHTGFLDHLASRGYRWSGNKHCTWCGRYWRPLDYRGLFPRCEGCSDDRTYNRRALFLAKESEEPPEVRFAGMFKAARMLRFLRTGLMRTGCSRPWHTQGSRSGSARVGGPNLGRPWWKHGEPRLTGDLLDV